MIAFISTTPEDAARNAAHDFVARWELAWNGQDARTVAQLYTPDAVFVGSVIAVGQSQITGILQKIMQQGWTKIQMTVAEFRWVGEIVLVAIAYTVTGSGESAGKTLEAKSTHVLTRVNGEWLSAMHTAV